MKSLYTRIGLALSLLASVALGGCAGGSAVLQNTVATIEQQVQADANVLCGFIPTAATIAAFIPGFGVIAASAATIAEGVCSAVAQAPVVQAQSARMRSAKLGVNVTVGSVKLPNVSEPVPIVGQFTR